MKLWIMVLISPLLVSVPSEIWAQQPRARITAQLQQTNYHHVISVSADETALRAALSCPSGTRA
jgi:hypothetical protein